MNQFLDQTPFLVVTCIHEKLDSFAYRILAFLTFGQTTSDWSLRPGPLDLAQIYSGSPPRGGRNPMRAVMWTPRTLPDWTAFYVNSIDGRSHLFAKLSQARIGPETMSIRSTLPDVDGGVQEFQFRSPGSTPTKPTRLLMWLEEENGYEFTRIGEPLAFERSGSKQSNPIETRKDLLAFVRRFGIDLEDEEFWKTDSEAVYLDQTWLPHREEE